MAGLTCFFQLRHGGITLAPAVVPSHSSACKQNSGAYCMPRRIRKLCLLHACAAVVASYLNAHGLHVHLVLHVADAA